MGKRGIHRCSPLNGNERLNFASAMTMLGYNDGDNASSGVSYLELVEFLIQNGANTTLDLKELWKRIVFSICISNTDDQLRLSGLCPKIATAS